MPLDVFLQANNLWGLFSGLESQLCPILAGTAILFGQSIVSVFALAWESWEREDRDTENGVERRVGLFGRV